MQFSPAAVTSMLQTLGQTFELDGAPHIGLFSAPGKVVDQFGQVLTTAPTLTVSEETASLIEPGESLLTVDGTDYLAVQLLPDGAGFVSVELTKDTA